MPSLTLDTHSVIWYLDNSSRLSDTARQSIRSAIETGHPVYLSSITIVEVIYLVEKGRLQQIQLKNLIEILHRPYSGFRIQPFDLEIAERLAEIPRDIIPDMPDRMIAATALFLRLPLVTVDHKISLSSIDTIW